MLVMQATKMWATRALTLLLNNPKAALGELRRPGNLGRRFFSQVLVGPRVVDAPTLFRCVTGQARPAFSKYVDELEASDFFRSLSRNLEATYIKAERGKVCLTAGFLDDHGYSGVGRLLYALVRSLRPEVVVETGVANGESSALVLKALDMNGGGALYSVDLPACPGQVFDDGLTYYIPEDKEVGWLVPSHLRSRWTLLLGDAKDLLPSLLQQLGSIDLFYHDSLHTYEQMTFEYTMAWNYLKAGGIVLSDDCQCSAFEQFCRSHGRAGLAYGTFGALIKR